MQTVIRHISMYLSRQLRITSQTGLTWQLGDNQISIWRWEIGFRTHLYDLLSISKNKQRTQTNLTHLVKARCNFRNQSTTKAGILRYIKEPVINKTCVLGEASLCTLFQPMVLPISPFGLSHCRNVCNQV